MAEETTEAVDAPFSWVSVQILLSEGQEVTVKAVVGVIGKSHG